MKKDTETKKGPVKTKECSIWNNTLEGVNRLDEAEDQISNLENKVKKKKKEPSRQKEKQFFTRGEFKRPLGQNEV